VDVVVGVVSFDVIVSDGRYRCLCRGDNNDDDDKEVDKDNGDDCDGTLSMITWEEEDLYGTVERVCKEEDGEAEREEDVEKVELGKKIEESEENKEEEDEEYSEEG